MIGKKFGLLTVVSLSDKRDSSGKLLWDCICDCQLNKPITEQKHCYVTTGNLKSGGTKSCGCLDRKRRKGNKYRYVGNNYDMSKEYGIGYSTNTKDPFYFDKEDYEIIAKYTWHTIKEGYLRAVTNRWKDANGEIHQSTILLHRLIASQHKNLQQTGDRNVIDHINGNPSDNRKVNLRIATQQENTMNQKMRSDNSTGHKGVLLNKRSGKYIAVITKNHKSTHLGTFDTVEEAGVAYDDASAKLFGEFTRAKEYLNNGSNMEDEDNAKLS